jgi:MFS family permease
MRQARLHTGLRTGELAVVLFVQMLPATLVAPAIRPVVGDYHGFGETVMQAFMSVNMLGAVLAAPLVGYAVDRGARPGRLLLWLSGADAVLLSLLTFPMGTGVLLALRTVEGAAHVGAATALLAHAASAARGSKQGRSMGMAGAAIMFAVASGHGIGAGLVGWDPRAAFWAGSLVAIWVALYAVRMSGPATESPRERGSVYALLRESPALWAPVTAAFASRFSVGCVIVTFAVFAHSTHGMSDPRIGMLFALMTFLFAFGVYPAGRLIERIPGSLVFAMGALSYAACLLVLGHAPVDVLPWVMGLAGVGSAMLFAPVLYFGARLGGREGRGRAMSLVNAAGCLGMLLGPACAAGMSSVLGTQMDSASVHRATFVVAGGSVLVWLVSAAPWLVREFRRERFERGFESRAVVSNSTVPEPASGGGHGHL